MSQRKKIIAVCITKAQDYSHARYLQYLHQQATKNGFKLMIFNSHVDFYTNDFYDKGESSVYEIINYDLIDALIIQVDSFQNHEIFAPLIKEAERRGIPVLSVNAVLPGCYSLMPESTSAYKSIINHIIQDHGVTDTFFIAGRRNDTNSDFRLKIYKEVLAENNLPFSESQVDYGDYWHEPTYQIIDRLHESGHMPEAFICANDHMAIAAIDRLTELGYRVPEDTLVTGYDGVSAGTYCEVPLTTCVENNESLADLSIAVIKRAMTGKLPTDVFYNSYSARIACSCGCMKEPPYRSKKDVAALQAELESALSHEDFMYNWMNRTSEVNDIYTFEGKIATILLKDSCLCLNENLTSSIQNRRPDSQEISETLKLIFSRNVSRHLIPDGPMFNRNQMIPFFDEWLEDDTAIVFNSIHADSLTCGYYCAPTKNLIKDLQTIKRITKSANIAFSILIRRIHQIGMIRNIENAAFIDAMTGLSNIRGVSNWFEEMAKNPANHEKTLTISVYALPKYSYIMETFGIFEMEESIKWVAKTLIESNKETTHISRIAEDEFLVINILDDPNQVASTIDSATNAFFSKNSDYNRNTLKGYYVEVNCGCTVANPGWSDTLENFIRQALGEMYQNRLANNPGEIIKESSSPRDYYGSFNLLLDKNLFVYHFQPIVDAKTGAIYAYEALMRTTGGVNMSPMDVLATATEYKRLYEIEKATMFNVMNRFRKDYNTFGGCKVFINTIPGHFLSDADCDKLHEEYERYLDSFVFELTEQDSVTEHELSAIRRLGKNGTPAVIAIDDYGTGHSNIVNLLRYNPAIIKVDRFLISGIDKDPNKQMFVKNTIEFARMNGIKVLAEGVETYDEMKTVIDFGVHYIQGYYTGKPAENPVTSINPRIQNEIIAENIRLKVNDAAPRIYEPQPREEMDIMSLAIRDYDTIQFPSGEFSVKSGPGQMATLIMVVKPSAEVTLHLHNISLESKTLLPCLDLGIGSRCTLVLHGDNHLDHVGIHVPESTSLRITGDGNLTVNHDRNYSTGIGANFEEPCGEMIFDLGGTLSVDTNGDRAVSIGGQAFNEKPLRILRGTYKLYAGGNTIVGIGTSTGNGSIFIHEGVTMSLEVNGHDIVGLGSLSGNLHLETAANLAITGNGDRAVGLGSHSENASLAILGGVVSSKVYCDTGSAVGTIDGSCDLTIENADLTAYGEGNRLAGIGAILGDCVTHIPNGVVRSSLLAAKAVPLGNENTVNQITGGCILVPEDLNIRSQSPSGVSLKRYLPSGDQFEQVITLENEEYTYTANRDSTSGRLEVYLPQAVIDCLNN